MKCPKCQTEVTPGDKFCRECGHDLRKPVEALSKDYSEPHSYTPKHLTERILTTRSSIEGEKKLVTVLFADVAEYTALAEKLDPERVHQVMDGCFKVLMDQIHRYEGTINQFTGDGVMALFGAPLTHEDHAQRACLAALGIQQTLEKYAKDLQAKHGIVFKMRVGLNSGPVVVGSIGDDLRMDYTAVGDTTNLAARMESMAEPGTTLLTEYTYKIVSQYVKCKSLGKVEVKGRENHVEVYRLEANHDVHRPRLGLERQIYSQMLGRDTELNKLQLQVMKAVNGEGSIVNIIGEAGIGKSRLVAELKNREVMKQVALLEGRAISMGRNLSFHSIIDLLKHWARIKGDDSELSSFDKLRSSIRNVCPEDTDEVLPFVATLMGMKLTGMYAERVKGIEGEALEKLILKNVRDLVTKATDQAPLVIVTEDLHWADTSSIQLLESLFRLTETQRIVFVNVFRPGHKETSVRIVETIKEKHPTKYREILLQPLDERTSEALIHNILNITGLDHRIRQQIIERSGGNPFFIEEVVRSFIDEGAVVNKNGAFEVTEKIHKIVIPQTINDVLMARIDRLEEKTRDLIKIASVIGRSFFHKILTELTRTTEDMGQRLSYLKEIQLIRERKRMEELEYLFKHALAQEAAYESILVERRKGLHLKVADSIERVFTERLHEFYGMLAFHYTKAEEEGKAEEYLIKAGEEALKSSGSSEALHYYHEALNLYVRKHGNTADPKKIAMLEKNIAHAYLYKGQFTEAAEYFNRVLVFYGEKEIRLSVLGISKLILRSLYFFAGLHLPFLRWKKDPSDRDSEINYIVCQKGQSLIPIDAKKLVIEAINHSNRVIALNISKLNKGIVVFTGYSGISSWGGISFSISRKILEVVKEKINKDDVYSLLTYGTGSIAYSYLSGDWEFAKEYDDDLVNQNLKTIDLAIPSYVGLHGIVRMERGRYADAKDSIHKLSQIGNVYEHEFSLVEKYYGNTLFSIKYRELREVLVEVDEGINFIYRTAFTVWLFAMYSMKAGIQIMMGDIQEAENTLQYANEIKSEIYPPPFFLRHFFLSNFNLHLYQLKQSIKTASVSEIPQYTLNALKAGKKAIKNSRKVVFDQIEIYRLMGVYYWLIKKETKSLEWWGKSIAVGERLDARLELSRTYMEVGKRLLEPRSKHRSLNGIEPEEYLEKAKTMFEEMDLRYDLEELERIAVTK